MSPNHPRWGEFCGRLASAEGINRRTDENGRYRSSCGYNFEKSTAILTTMKDIDVQGSLDYFREHGGYCDCRVLCYFDIDGGVECRNGWDV